MPRRRPTVLQVVVPDDFRDWMDQQRAREGLSRSSFLRRELLRAFSLSSDVSHANGAAVLESNIEEEVPA